MDRVSLPPRAPAAPAPQQPQAAQQPGAPAQPAAPARQVSVTEKQQPMGGRPVTAVSVESGAPASDRPEWLPAKFNSAQELAAAYSQLEQRLGSGALEQRAADEGAALTQRANAAGQRIGLPTEDAPAPTAPTAELENALAAEYAQTGQISPQSRAKFTEKTGLSDRFIDQHLAFMQQREVAAVDIASRRLGSQEAVRELMQWAATNLNPQERKAFNDAAYSHDPHMVELAIDGLSARYEGSVGRHPRVIAGRKPQADHGGLVPFQSDAEWTEARRDPRYKRDPAYRAEVADRLALSQRLGLFN